MRPLDPFDIEDDGWRPWDSPVDDVSDPAGTAAPARPADPALRPGPTTPHVRAARAVPEYRGAREPEANARAVGSRPSLRADGRRPLPGTPDIQATALPEPAPGARARRKLSQRAPRDPAPSRTAYRLHRLWLTPIYRRSLRIGLPLALVAGIVGGWLVDEGRRDALVTAAHDLHRSFQQRPEFMVQELTVSATTPELQAAVAARVEGRLPVSSFDLDLDALRRGIEQIDAVERAELRILSGGRLEVRLIERSPVIVWRGPAGLELMDAGGARVALLAVRGARPDLPLIAGDGAAAHIPEALALFEAAQPLSDRLRGLVRIGERRWDVVLDRNQRIMLPERGAQSALERVIALEQAQDLLSRDLLAVDLRSPDRPTIRLATEAFEELRRIRRFEMGVTSQ